MSGQQGSPPSGAGPVVICCATPDRTEIDAVVRELEQQGHAVEVVDGVETDVQRLGPVIDRCHGEGLYVLVRSRSLGREVVDELREVLLGRHVPFGRTLTVASKRSRELLERIQNGLKRVAAGRARRMSKVPVDGGTRRRHPTVLGIPVPSPNKGEPPAPPPPKPARRERMPTQLGIVVQEVANAVRAASSAPPPPPSSDEPGTPVVPEDDPDSFEEEAPTNVSGRKKRARRGRVAARPVSEPATDAQQNADLSESESADERPATSRPPPPPARVAAMPGPEDSIGSGELIKPEDLADLGQSADNLPIIRDGGSSELRRALITGDTAVVDLNALSRGGNTVRAAVVPEPVLADDDDVDEGDEPSAFPATAPAPDVRSSFGSPPVPGLATAGAPMTAAPTVQRRSNPPWLAIGLVAATLVLGLGTVAVVSSGDDEAAKADDQRADAKTEDEASKTPEPEPEPEPEPIVGKEPGVARTQVMEALRKRSVRALDILLVTGKDAGPMPFPEARTHCSNLEVDGLGGWRLPEVGELSSLTEAGMLGRGFYWSATAADTFGDVRLSWWGRRERIVQRDKDAFVACVRGNGVAD